MKSKSSRNFLVRVMVTAITTGLIYPASAANSGDRDTTFGTDGKVITGLGVGFDQSRAVAIDGSGKLVIAGSTMIGSNREFAVLRLNNDGSLDTSFNSNGGRITDFGSNDDAVTSIAIGSDGKIVVAGYTNNAGNYDFAVVRYNSDGSLDTTFDSDGKVITAVGSMTDEARAVIIESSGKIVVAGYSEAVNNNFALVRYNVDGTLDTSFDTDGKVTTDFGASVDVGESLVMDSSGKFVVAGFSNSGGTNDFAAARYNSNGSLDTTFDTDGKVTIAFGSGSDVARDLAIDSTGKIVIAGLSSNGTYHDFALTRINSDGSLDSSFGTSGKVTTVFGPNEHEANAIAIDSNGKIVVAGTYSDSSAYFAVARYTSSGILDTTFGTNGKVTTQFSFGDSYARSLVIDNAGKIVLVGFSTDGSNEQTAVARYLVNSSAGSDSAAVSEAARIAAAKAAADAAAAKKAKDQKELMEILALIPAIAGTSLSLGTLSQAALLQKCSKGKTVKFVKKGAKCPKGYVRKK